MFGVAMLAVPIILAEEAEKKTLDALTLIAEVVTKALVVRLSRFRAWGRPAH